MARMRSLIANDALDTGAVTRGRLELSRASTARTRFLNDTVYPALLRSGGDAADRARRIRDEAAADRARSSAHVAKWSAAALARDWAGFRRDAAAILDMMAARVARERELAVDQAGRTAPAA